MATTESGTSEKQAGIFSLQFAGDYWVTMRPYLLFISGITGLAGLALAPQIAWHLSLPLIAAFFFSYGFGQALTDCFQMDTDRLSSPYRPLVRGRIRKQDVLRVSVVGLIACAIAWTVFQPMNLAWSLLGITGLATYTWFKKRWWAGPFYNAWIVVLLGFLGYSAGTGAAGVATTATSALVWTLLTVFFGYANFVLTGYFKDVSADRTTGYNTLVVTHGFRVSTFTSDLFAVLTVASAGLALWQSPLQVGSIPFVLAGAGFAFVAQARLHRVREEAQSHPAIAAVLHSYVLLLSSEAIAHKPAWTPWLALFYLAFVITLKARPSQSQI